jgi:hypothetical protein
MGMMDNRTFARLSAILPEKLAGAPCPGLGSIRWFWHLLQLYL